MQEGSINKMIESSQVHEVAGRLNQALIELDAPGSLKGRSAHQALGSPRGMGSPA
jgi:hypothetical protein